MNASEADRFAELIETRPAPAAADSTAESGADRQLDQLPELLSVVYALRDLDFDVELLEPTRARQRQRLVAMAAVRTSQTGEPADAGRHRARHTDSAGERPGVWADVLARLRGVWSARPVLVGFGGLSVIFAVIGILALLAQSAIPGDWLYALKRGTEEARLVLAGSDQNHGRALLGFASTRLDELDQLLDEPVSLAATGSGAQAAGADDRSALLIDTMDTMDRQTTAGTSAMTTSAVDHAEVETLGFVAEWGVGQFRGLDELSARMPAAAQDRATESMDLLQEVIERLDGLAQAMACDCLDAQSPLDALGPIPCTVCPDSSTGASDIPANPGLSTGPADPGSAPLPTNAQTSDEPPAVATDSSIPPAPPAEGSECLIGIEIGIIVGGVCVPLPPPPNEGESCVLVDLPWPSDDVLGIIVGGVCVIA